MVKTRYPSRFVWIQVGGLELRHCTRPDHRHCRSWAPLFWCRELETFQTPDGAWWVRVVPCNGDQPTRETYAQNLAGVSRWQAAPEPV